MKRHFLYLCCCLCVTLLAYSHIAYAGTAKADRNIKGRDSLYLQVYGGINKSANENLPMSEILVG